MPLYDYQCGHCGESFEEFRSLAERETAPCPRCGERATQAISSFFTNSSSGRGSAPANSGPAGACGGMRGGG